MSSIDWKKVGKRIRSLRREPQIPVAKRLGITQGQLSRIETGASPPSIETLLEISKLYKKAINWLLLGE